MAQKQISQKYDEIERSLIEEFAKAQAQGDRVQMKKITSILSHFKGYSQCIDAYIEQSQQVRYCRAFQRTAFQFHPFIVSFVTGGLYKW